MKIVITGGTGFVGRPLVDSLVKAGHQVSVLTRDTSAAASQMPGVTFADWTDVDTVVHGSDAVVHLAGENLFGKRWTPEMKRKIIDSRVKTTAQLVESMRRADPERRPSVFVSASAVGYYGDSGNRLLTEDRPPADDFLAEVCVRWEAEAQKAPAGIRVVNPRLGIVLHPDGGALKQMLLPFRLFVGGSLGSGDQYFPWIDRKDLVRVLEFLLHNEALHGPVNAVAPNPVTMSEFAKTLGRVMGRPSFFKVPEFALSLALGEAASSVVASLRVVPKVLQDAGFQWKYPPLEDALKARLV